MLGWAKTSLRTIGLYRYMESLYILQYCSSSEISCFPNTEANTFAISGKKNKRKKKKTPDQKKKKMVKEQELIIHKEEIEIQI